ncbi:MAG: STAS domain-containing protein [Oscillospiraceae bacterium]|jgi:stage II sporulation protein AA (anti-sigma F factor antagonist)|nr:STAS domain-containing protein [Oscillospiraceae bacterium]
MNLETEFEAGTLRLHFDGELDHHAAKRAVVTIEEYIDTFLPRRCVLDFRGVTFMDSSGIAVLVKTRRRMDELDGSLGVENIRRQPMRVLRAAGIDRILGVAAAAVKEA